MSTPTNYNAFTSEEKWYEYWTKNNFFHSEVDNTKEPYCVVIPPPNVTGILHMGHMLNNTIQDVLVRRAKLSGKNACWVPGTDHASIATEAKVVNKLAQEGIKKSDLSREEFLRHAWKWTDVHGGIILKQLRKLGASCDWQRTAFTMDKTRSESVIKCFTDLYKEGLIYRGVRMVNWDPKAKTALSDEEVVYKDEHSKLYYLRYRLSDDSSKYIVVATTRPETILGDSAVCINPNDKRYTWLKGKHVIVPLVNREIPIIEDEYVDIEFGTGCLKVTPAHDVNDYMLGEKYNLPIIDIFNDDGTISQAGGMYIGMDRFDVRTAIVKDIEKADLLEKVEDYDNKVGFSERTNVVIEPKLSMQWFLKMSELAKPALDAVMNDDIKFYPSKYKNTYKYWMENIKDWCISRQLWWGHRIPAYFLPEGGVVVAATPEEALQEAIKKTGNHNLTIQDLRQDSDCLDTWFSSWLWPISLFDGINNPNNKEIEYYYPTNDLVTGPDIIFFWVARMIMAGYKYMGDKPFRNVYFTGIVRDKLGRKMSKQLGNSPDALELISKYGADGVRVGMLLCSPAGGDLLYDESLSEQGRNFVTKMWNAFKLVQMWQVEDIEQPQYAKLATDWFENKIQSVATELKTQFEQYRISEALMTIYTAFRDDFSSWYLEIVKPAYGQPIDRQTYNSTIKFFCQLLQQLHPFTPFITEEIWQDIESRQSGDSIMKTTYEKISPYDVALTESFERVKDIVANIRTIRKQNNIAFKEPLTLMIKKNDRYPSHFQSIICKLCNIDKVENIDNNLQGAWQFISDAVEYFIPSDGNVDTEELKAKLEGELKYAEGFLNTVMKKLGNEKFMAGAPADVVAKEQKKKEDAEAKIAVIKTQLSHL